MAQISADGRGLRLAVRYTVLTLIAVMFIFPLVFMLGSSLKLDAQLLAAPQACAPSCRWATSFWATAPPPSIALPSVCSSGTRLTTGVTALLSLLVCSMAAFVFVQWQGRDLILTIILATLIVPFETIAIPLLLISSKLPWIGLDGLKWGWLNSCHGQIAPFMADGLTIYLFVQYFKDLPGELIEAARVEGAIWAQIYRKIVMPLAGPVPATAAILNFLAMYNQYLWPLMVVQEEGYHPVMVGLQYFFQLNRAWGEIMAYLSLITIPVLAFYLYLQKAFIAAIASTGVKG